MIFLVFPLPVPADQAWRYVLCFRCLIFGKIIGSRDFNTLAGTLLFGLNDIGCDLLDRPPTSSTVRI